MLHLRQEFLQNYHGIDNITLRIHQQLASTLGKHNLHGSGLLGIDERGVASEEVLLLGGGENDHHSLQVISFLENILQGETTGRRANLLLIQNRGHGSAQDISTTHYTLHTPQANPANPANPLTRAYASWRSGCCEPPGTAASSSSTHFPSPWHPNDHP